MKAELLNLCEEVDLNYKQLLALEAFYDSLMAKIADRIEQEFVKKEPDMEPMDWAYHLGYNNAILKTVGLLKEFK